MTYDISDRVYCLTRVDNIESGKNYNICGGGDLFMVNTNRTHPIKGQGFCIEDCNRNQFYVTVEELNNNFIYSHIMESKIYYRDVKINKILS